MEFSKKKIVTPEGMAQWVFTQVPVGNDAPFPPLQLIADKTGMRFEGKSCLITDMRDLQDFAQVVSEAWVEHDKLLKAALGQIVIASGGLPDAPK